MNKVGVPKGVYNVVHGFGPDSAGEFLTAPPGRQRHHLHRRDAHRHGDHEGRRRRHRAPVSLELGGKNAGIVFADCDFDDGGRRHRRARASRTAGQVCLGTERVYVERPIFDKFVAALKAKAESMKPGRP